MVQVRRHLVIFVDYEDGEPIVVGEAITHGDVNHLIGRNAIAVAGTGLVGMEGYSDICPPEEDCHFCRNLRARIESRGGGKYT